MKSMFSVLFLGLALSFAQGCTSKVDNCRVNDGKSKEECEASEKDGVKCVFIKGGKCMSPATKEVDDCKDATEADCEITKLKNGNRCVYDAKAKVCVADANNK